MQFGRFVRFLGMLLLGVAIALMTSPVNAQDFNVQDFKQKLQNCYTEASQYQNYDDLDKYEESELYCLFMIELVEGGVAVDKEYDTEALDDAIQAALYDEGDMTGASTTDTFLRYEEIQDEFSNDELNALIQQAVLEADQQTAVRILPLVQGMKTIAPKHQKAPNGTQPAIAQSSNGKARGGSAVNAFANGASQQARRN